MLHYTGILAGDGTQTNEDSETLTGKNRRNKSKKRDVNKSLRTKLCHGVEIVGFADDIVLTVTGDSLEEVKMLATEAISQIESWMQGAKLQIAHHKTEMLLVSNCKEVQRAEITVGEHVITLKRELKYLNFNSHVDYACEKVAKAINAVARIMPNSYGPSSSKRRLLASVSSSILRYGAWVTALRTSRNRGCATFYSGQWWQKDEMS